jgi:hypothetical protein
MGLPYALNARRGGNLRNTGISILLLLDIVAFVLMLAISAMTEQRGIPRPSLVAGFGISCIGVAILHLFLVCIIRGCIAQRRQRTKDCPTNGEQE